MRAPRVAGVSGGVGTTTVAQALYGVEEPCEPVQPAPSALFEPAPLHAAQVPDIIVCRSYAESLARAAHIADRLDPATGPLPVLAVTLDSADRRRPRPLRLAELGPGWSAVVLLPHTRRWRDAADPYGEAAGLLGTQASGLPRGLRPYAAAISELVRAVVGSGRLAAPGRDVRPGPSGAKFLPRRPPPVTGFPADVTEPGRGVFSGPRSALIPRPAAPARGLGPELRAVRGISLVLPERVGIPA